MYIRPFALSRGNTEKGGRPMPDRQPENTKLVPAQTRIEVIDGITYE